METRYTEQTGIVIRCQEAYNVTFQRNEKVWGHFDCNDCCQGRHVGPWYKTKEEALADHAAYLVRAGWLKKECV